ncbi:MAG: hypothetical protein RLZZ50_923, partial [Verrucomicrobiota bacterium]
YVGYTIDPALTSARYEVDYVRVYQAAPAPALSAYQLYLQGLSLSTSLAFDADGDGDGVAEGVRYAFGDASPRLGTSPAALSRDGNAYTYTFDVRDDTDLVLTPEVSNDLASWTTATNYTLTPTTGASSGFVRHVLVVNTTPAGRVFFRLRVAN